MRTPLGTRSRRLAHSVGRFRWTFRRSASDRSWSMRAVSCEKTPSRRPEPHRGEVLVFAGRKVDDAVDATPSAGHPAVLQVPLGKLGRVAGERRLLGRDETLVGDRQLEEAVPAWSCLAG